MSRTTHIKHRDVPTCEIQQNGHQYKTSHVKAGKPRRSWDVISVHELPPFLNDNKYLLHGHRPVLTSPTECLLSAFALHTETWNIWTHFLGAVGVLFLSVYYLTFVATDWPHLLSFATFFLGAILCMGVSATYHTFICHSERTCRFLAKMDYAGVIVLIVTSYAPWLHFAFYCKPEIKMTYMLLVMVLGLLCIAVVTQDQFRDISHAHPWLRAGLFACLGLTGVIPCIHYVFYEQLLNVVSIFLWLVSMALLYVTGAVAYAARIPERLAPGTFDIWCHSHQILHVCVVGGVITCYMGASRLAVARLALDSSCPLEL